MRLVVPERGAKRQLQQLAQENSTAALNEHLRLQAESQEALQELQKLLGLAVLPRRIECFDISNTMGAQSVASMVVWENGRMKKSDYRRFRIKTVEGANDFASMNEVVKRRYGGTLATKAKKILPSPDLIVLDGGVGQLGAAMEAMSDLGLSKIARVWPSQSQRRKSRTHLSSRPQNPHHLATQVSRFSSGANHPR